MTLFVIMTNVAFRARGKIGGCSVHHQFTVLQKLQNLNLQRGKKKTLTGKNNAGRQQDAYGPEKDGWLDPGNGEKRKGRRDSGSQLCSD